MPGWKMLVTIGVVRHGVTLRQAVGVLQRAPRSTFHKISGGPHRRVGTKELELVNMVGKQYWRAASEKKRAVSSNAISQKYPLPQDSMQRTLGVVEEVAVVTVW